MWETSRRLAVTAPIASIVSLEQHRAMLLGANITSASSFRCTERFWDEELIDFVELMVDGFIHLDPDEVACELRGKPVAFHIMTSRFLHRSSDELKRLARLVRLWIDRLRPIYVSDHLGIHAINGQLLPDMMEANYADPNLITLIARWRDLLDCKLILENFPSVSVGYTGQVGFFETLQQRTGVEPLFDFSNAMIAEMNGADEARAWLNSSIRFSACHISGYRAAECDSRIIVDSHDCEVSADSWMFLQDAILRGKAPETLVVERDVRLSQASWGADLRRARILCHNTAR